VTKGFHVIFDPTPNVRTTAPTFKFIGNGRSGESEPSGCEIVRQNQSAVNDESVAALI